MKAFNAHRGLNCVPYIVNCRPNVDNDYRAADKYPRHEWDHKALPSQAWVVDAEDRQESEENQRWIKPEIDAGDDEGSIDCRAFIG